jgi:hypothetical protein
MYKKHLLAMDAAHSHRYEGILRLVVVSRDGLLYGSDTEHTLEGSEDERQYICQSSKREI